MLISFGVIVGIFEKKACYCPLDGQGFSFVMMSSQFHIYMMDTFLLKL